MDKIALVTGINRGIGHGFAKQLIDCGFHVIGTCRDPSTVTAHQQLTVEQLDIQDDLAIKQLADKYADTPIDLLINNAAVLYADSQLEWKDNCESIGSLSRKAMLKTIEINAVSAIKVTEAFIPHILKGELKQIIAISSEAGSITHNITGGHISYRMSKAALNMGMREFAIQYLQQGIHVMLLDPGWVQTDMGGAHAAISVDTSVEGMLKVIEGRSQFFSGGFYNYRGEACPF